MQRLSRRGLLVCATIFALHGGTDQPRVSAQSCTWGGTPITAPPTATHLFARIDSVEAPTRIATDAAGNLYAIGPKAGVAVVWDPNGCVQSTRSGLRSPLAIAVGQAGDIYIAEEQTGAVTVFDPNWNVRTVLGRGAGEFLLPTDIAVDPDPAIGKIYVADGVGNLINVYEPNGAYLFSFGGVGSAPGQLNFPAAVHISAGGKVFVADQNNDRIQVFARDGTFMNCFGSSGGMSFGKKFGRIQGLTSDAQGRLYVADAFHGHVRVFESTGAPLSTIGSFGNGPGKLRTPTGLVIDRFNRLFVASTNTGRLEVFGLDAYVEVPACSTTGDEDDDDDGDDDDNDHDEDDEGDEEDEDDDERCSSETSMLNEYWKTLPKPASRPREHKQVDRVSGSKKSSCIGGLS